MNFARLFAVILGVISLIFSGCSDSQKHNKSKTNLDRVNWQRNSHAKFFRIGTTRTDTLLEIYFDSLRVLQKFHRGKHPHHFQEYTHIPTINSSPKIAVLTSAYSAFLNQLQVLGNIIAVDHLTHWTQSTIAQLPLKDKTPQIQKGGNLNVEKLLQLKPDITFTYTLDPKIDLRISQFNKLVYIQNHFEVHPLAKAEWIRVFGYFLQKSQITSTLFQKEKTSYDSIASLISLSQTQIPVNKPKIMVNLPYSGVWWVPQKNNYFTQLIYDAGGDPLWITSYLSGNNSVQISMEKALSHVQNCDILLNPGSIKNIKEIADERIAQTITSKKPKIWQNDQKMESTGANPFWDLGSSQPHLLLLDLQNIFYGNGENTYFYRQIKFHP